MERFYPASGKGLSYLSPAFNHGHPCFMPEWLLLVFVEVYIQDGARECDRIGSAPVEYVSVHRRLNS